MTPSASPTVPDFRPLNFPRLWAGRDRTTQVEAAVIARHLAAHDGRRRAELGTGVGRLTEVVRSGAAEYLGLDHQPEFLAALAAERPPDARHRYVAANLYHLPMRDRALTSSVSIRVFNFLEDPAAALREIYRVTMPGGRLLLTFHPHPSLGSLTDDVKVALASPEPGVLPRPRTFARGSPVPVHPAAVPSWSWRRSEFRRLAVRAGWRLAGQSAVGLEDYRLLRRLPPGVFAGLADLSPIVGLRPTWFTDWVRPADGRAEPEGALDEIWACPSCHAPIALAARDPSRCPQCGVVRGLGPPVLDLRYPRPDPGGDGPDPGPLEARGAPNPP